MECASRIWPPSSCRTKDLRPCTDALLPVPGLEVAPHLRVGVGSRRGADEIVGGPDIRDPVPQRLVHRVLQRSASGEDRGDLRPEEPHPDDVRFLATDIFRAHVDHAGNPHLRAYRRCGDPVLPRPRLGDDPALPPSSPQKTPAQRVVDLVGARGAGVPPLEEDVRPFSLLREAAREVEGGRTAAVLPEQAVQFRQESLVPGHLPVCLLQVDERRHQRFRHVPPPEGAEVPRPVGPPFTCRFPQPRTLPMRCPRTISLFPGPSSRVPPRRRKPRQPRRGAPSGSPPPRSPASGPRQEAMAGPNRSSRLPRTPQEGAPPCRSPPPISTILPGLSLTTTPTTVAPPPTASTIGAATRGSTYRADSAKKLIPTASAPASTAKAP